MDEKRERVDWSTVGHVHDVGWGTDREDGGPDAVAIRVHFPGETGHRIVVLDPDDVEAIFDEVRNRPDPRKGVH